MDKNAPHPHTSEQPLPDVDALIVGAGPAGLQAALTLGRMHRTALLVDDGRPRNAAAGHMHNFLTHDGTPPEAFRSIARAQLAAYATVSQLDARLEAIRPLGEGGFAGTLSDGRGVTARRVVLATGVRDRLPEVEGLAEHFGTLVHHCPFCHGHELTGGRVGILVSPFSGHLAMLLGPIADEVVLLDGLTSVAEVGGRLEARLPDGSTEVLDGLFVRTELAPSAPHADQLGLERTEGGGIAVDLMGRTSLPGVFAAGDAAHHRDLPMPSASVLAAAAAGQAAGAAVVADLIMEPAVREPAHA